MFIYVYFYKYKKIRNNLKVLDKRIFDSYKKWLVRILNEINECLWYFKWEKS